MTQNNVIDIFTKKPVERKPSNHESIKAAKLLSKTIKELMEEGIDVSKMIVLWPSEANCSDVMVFSNSMSSETIVQRIVDMAERVKNEW